MWGRRRGEGHRLLPKVSQRDDIEQFIILFENTLTQEVIPEDKWKQALIHNLPQKARNLVAETLNDGMSTFQDAKQALLEATGMTAA